MSERSPLSALTVFMLIFVVAAFLSGKLLGLPDDWWRHDILPKIPFSALAKVLAISLVAALLGSTVVSGARSKPSGLYHVDAAMRIMEGVQGRFFAECKTYVRQGYYPLLEYMPSKVSGDQEEEFLRDNHEIPAAIDHLTRAIAIEEDASANTTGAEAARRKYNVANARLKLGRVYRFSRNWDAALKEFRSATTIFEKLADDDYGPNVYDELATAYLSIGEVHMARHKLTGTQSDRAAALEALAKSAEIDQRIGKDCNHTQLLMCDLR